MSDGAPSSATRRGILAVVAVQVLVPLIVLVGVVALGWDRPVRAGWQMYSSLGAPRTITVELADGTTEERTSSDHRLNRREMQVDADLLRRLCAAEPDATALSGVDGTRVVCP